MLKPEEKAIHLFNRALKTCICLGMEPNKQNAKEIVLNNCLAVKEALFDMTIIDEIPANRIGKSLEYNNKVKKIIEEL